MNWIKANPFVATLAAITIFLCTALYFVGSKGAAKYDAAKASFDESFNSVQSSEGIPVYPTAALRDGKRKALAEYADAIKEFSSSFDAYRPGEIKTTSPQDFASSLVAANEEVTAALTSAGCEVPKSFFMGFTRYNGPLATEKAAGVLNYQLNGIKHALLNLAKSRPSKLFSVYRDEISEENDTIPAPNPDAISRTFGYEISFQGSEAAAREFLNSLGKTDTNYYIIRALKISNQSDTPPKVADAKFEKPPEPSVSEKATESPFGEEFVLPGDEKQEPAKKDLAPKKPIPEKAEKKPEPSPDASRILSPVLGSEELIVFVRFDLTMLLPAKELPKP